ncbi:MAG: TetR/AcrR family transcriptional regulator [Ilumatobacteraceae bacterium]
MAQGRSLLEPNEIDAAALGILATAGPDGLSIPRLARQAKVTTGPLYRRFDTGEDVTYDIWSRVLRAHLQRVLNALLAVRTDDTSSEADWVRGELARPGVESLATLHVLATAHRLGPVGEQVRRELDDDLSALVTRESSMPGLMVLAHATLALGSWLMARSWPTIGESTATELSTFSAAYSNPMFWSATGQHVPYRAPASLVTLSGDRAIDDLRLATMKVVSMYGCASATANRISRVAGRSVTSAYRQLGGKNELLADAITHALHSDLGFSGRESTTAVGFGREERLTRSFQVLRNQTSDDNRENRLFMLEVFLAAHDDPMIAAKVAAWLEGVKERFTSAATRLGDTSESGPMIRRLETRIGGGLGSLVLSVVAPRWIALYDPMPAVVANDSVMEYADHQNS